jgi:hypothetical protein
MVRYVSWRIQIFIIQNCESNLFYKIQDTIIKNLEKLQIRQSYME